MKQANNKWNRLVSETSPYLLQHAANPVNWYPWGEEAFAKAKQEDKPIFLSVGYSTCHWCHVMEHESFEDIEVAEILNQYFVCIKVDREERPDIDNAYMQVCQMLTGRGGWPLSVFMTTDKKPFHAGTYYPKYSRQLAGGVALGMLDLLSHIAKAWKEERAKVLKSADDIFDYAQGGEQKPVLSFAFNQKSDLVAKAKSLYQKAFEQLLERYDSKYGGFGSAPKFPSPHIFSFLLRYSFSFDNSEALQMLEHTLVEMRKGGIFDQIGFGFHRYSTDREWLLPHFEKMLYDQAMLMIAYAEAFKLTGDNFYRQVLDEVFLYLTRDLLSKEGAFYSAEDADSEGEEGKFYTWSESEFAGNFTGNDLKSLCEKYQVSKNGNFLDEASRETTGLNILHLKDFDQLDNTLKDLSFKLLELRSKRVRPFLDDKILTDWNALVIVALAKAYDATRDRKYLDRAELAYMFLNDKLKDTINKKLYKSYRAGKLNPNACLNDYAFLAWAALELFTVTCKQSYLDQAKELTDWMIIRFWDLSEGAFFLADLGHNDLPFRNKEFYDGAIPSGNSVAFGILLRLEKISADNAYGSYIAKLGAILVSCTDKYPIGYAQFLVGLDSLFDNSAFNNDLACST